MLTTKYSWMGLNAAQTLTRFFPRWTLLQQGASLVWKQTTYLTQLNESLSEWQADVPNSLVFMFCFLLLDFRVCPNLLTMNWRPMPKLGQWLMKSFHLCEQWLLLVVRKKRLKGWFIEMSATSLNFIIWHTTLNLPYFV